MDTKRFIFDVLVELRLAAMLINSEESWKLTMNKYGMMFIGENFNTIYARELRDCLEKVFNNQISMPELLVMIPDICSSLGMEIEPMTLVEDPDRKTADYQITLF